MTDEQIQDKCQTFLQTYTGNIDDFVKFVRGMMGNAFYDAAYVIESSHHEACHAELMDLLYAEGHKLNGYNPLPPIDWPRRKKNLVSRLLGLS